MTEPRNITDVSTGTAARMLHVTRMTVGRYLEQGILQGFRLHARGHWRVYLYSIEALINQRATEASAAESARPLIARKRLF